jgi:protein O-GlcNAc transferase
VRYRSVAFVLPLMAIGCGGAAAPTSVPFSLAPRPASVLRAEKAPAPRPIGQVVRLGEEALRLGRLDEARRYFDGVLERDPDHPRVNYYLGMIFERMGDNEQAKAWYRKAFRSDPDLAEAAINLSAVLLDEGSPGEAVTVLEAAVRRAPEDPLLNINLGFARSSSGDSDGAIAAYRSALRVAEHPETRLSIAAMLMSEGRDHEALAEVRRVRALSNERRDLLATVAFLFDQLGEYDDCVSSLDRAMLLEPAAELALQRGLCQLRKGDDKAAENDFRKALSLDAELEIAHCLLAEQLSARGAWQDALESSEWCAALAPDTPLGKRAAERVRKAGR